MRAALYNIDVLVQFATWTVGVVLTVLTFRVTRTLAWRTCTSLRMLVLAATFTPTFIPAHGGVMPGPAILVLGLLFRGPEFGPTSELLQLGGLPIALAWAGLMVTWELTRKLAWSTRANIRALVIAVAFTPSVFILISFPVNPVPPAIPAPAILVLVSFVMLPDWTYALLLGALPIALVWAALRFLWLRKPDEER